MNRTTTMAPVAQGRGLTSLKQELGMSAPTQDRHADLRWFAQACRDNVTRLEKCIATAEARGDEELADFFRRARSESTKGAEHAQDLLCDRLAKDPL